MSNQIITIIALLGMIGGIATLINLWLTDEQKGQLILKLREIYTTLNDSDPIAVIQAPMRGVEYIYITIFGEKILSSKSFKRSSLVSMLILIGSLAAAGWVINIPFAIKETPWKAYESYTSGLPSQIDKVIKGHKNKVSEEKKAKLAEMIAEVNKPRWKWVYSGGLVLLVVFFKVIFDILSFMVTRKFLHELLTTKQPMLIFSALFLNSFLVFFIGTITLILLTAAANPLVLVFFLISIAVPLNLFTIFSLVPAIWGATIKFAWLFGSTWIKVTALTTTLPIAILLLLCLLVLITFPVRGYIHKAICYTLERLINYDKGPLIFISACSVALISVLGGMVKLLL